MITKLYACLFTALLSCAARISAATIVWTNPSGGNWNVAANWTPNQVPGPGDNVFITNSGTYTVILNVNTTNASLTLGGASGTQTLTNFSQTLNLAGASTVGSRGQLKISGGTLTGAGQVAVNGSFHWAGGTISGSGAFSSTGLWSSVAAPTKPWRRGGSSTPGWRSGPAARDLCGLARAGC